MSRRRSAEASSLELLLDTICNTFGGVLFIAILVILLLQQAGNSPALQTPTSPTARTTSLELLTTMTRMDAATAELDRLRKIRDSQDVVVRTFAPATVQALLQTRSEKVLEQEALQSEVDQLRRDLGNLVVQIDQMAAANDEAKSRYDQMKSRVAELEALLEVERQSRVEQIRLPVVRTEKERTEIGVILRYGRLYVWHEYSDDGSRLGLNQNDFVVIGEDRGGLVIHANPLRGLVLDGSEDSKQGVRTVLRRFDPRQIHLVVIVRPDSYGVFRHLRDEAISLGFEYRLLVTEKTEPIVDRGGRGGQVQ